tara:strand:- start:2064 stop:2168 length:105 start_codon:yes stop_codon:yes gene_type:complete
VGKNTRKANNVVYPVMNVIVVSMRRETNGDVDVA